MKDLTKYGFKKPLEGKHTIRTLFEVNDELRNFNEKSSNGNLEEY